MFCCYCVLLCLLWSCLYNLGYVAVLVFTTQGLVGFDCGVGWLGGLLLGWLFI